MTWMSRGGFYVTAISISKMTLRYTEKSVNTFNYYGNNNYRVFKDKRFYECRGCRDKDLIMYQYVKLFDTDSEVRRSDPDENVLHLSRWD